MPEATWLLDQPALNSFEQVAGTQPGILSVDYTTGVDCRWRGQARLGPKLNSLSLAAAGGTAANANGAAVAPAAMQAAGPFLYVIRGTKWAKVQLSTLSLLSDGTETALAEAATDIIVTRAGDGAYEISLGMESTAYRVVTAVSAGATDTHSANTGGEIFRHFFHAGASTASGQIAGLGKRTTTVENIAAQNVLSGSNRMSNGAWSTRATLAGPIGGFTGGVYIDDTWLPGTQDGPYYLDEKFQEFRPLIDELDTDPAHCVNMRTWSLLGPAAIIPLARGVRLWDGGASVSVGPEMYQENRSPVTGRLTAQCYSERWGYWQYYNPVADQTYLLAVRPRLAGDWHSQALSFFPIGVLAAGEESHFAEYTGTQGGRTLPLVSYGRESDMGYFQEGRTDYFPDDSSYEYTASGTIYLTEMRRSQGQYLRPSWYEFLATGLGSGTTITLQLQREDGSYASFGPTWTGAIDGTASGLCRWEPRIEESESFRSRHPRPALVLASNAATASPAIEGPLRMGWEAAP